MHIAAAEGDIDKVSELIGMMHEYLQKMKAACSHHTTTPDVTKGSALVDPLKGDGTTPLINAVMMGHNRVVELLLEEGADVSKVGMNGATPLQIAASMGHIEVNLVKLQYHPPALILPRLGLKAATYCGCRY